MSPNPEPQSLARVPALDLARAVARIRPRLEERWSRLLAEHAFVGGREVSEFERAFAAYLGTSGCVGVANGTDALVIALQALELTPGDEVIVPAFTFVATASAVVLAGGRPVFADVDAATLNLDPADAAERVTERTVGIIGVHLYGRPFNVPALTGLCRQRHLWLLEDAAQAHGASLEGRRAGTFGELATWSFYPTKNLGCFGDGGAITGSDPERLSRIRRLANHGQERRYHHLEIGANSRLDALQAAVLNCRLELLEEDNARRREIARRYAEELAGVGDLRLLADPPDSLPVFHQMAVRTRRREELREFLLARGIETSIHYPSPLHLQPALRELAGGAALPESETAARELLCLPIFPELRDAEVDRVCAGVQSFFSSAT